MDQYRPSWYRTYATLSRTPHGSSASLGTATLVVEVEYRQRLKDGLRHAALKGLRPEKKPGLRGEPMSDAPERPKPSNTMGRDYQDGRVVVEAETADAARQKGGAKGLYRPRSQS